MLGSLDEGQLFQVLLQLMGGKRCSKRQPSYHFSRTIKFYFL